jgi:uncharacterized damage-inducible protein DinB
MQHIARPEPHEIPAYAVPYIDRLPSDADPLDVLGGNLDKMQELIRSVAAERLDIPFAAGEWTVKEILSHIMDEERIYVYPALRFARQDGTELAAMDHEAYVRNSKVLRRTIESILEEYRSIRQASLTFFHSLDCDDLACSGKIGGDVFSVRGILWLTAAHDAHHLNSIRENYR